MEFIKIKELCKKLSLSKSFIYSMIRSNNFPHPIKLSRKSAMWLLLDIEEWMILKNNTGVIKNG